MSKNIRKKKTRKVKVIVFDNDLRCAIKKYPLSANGKQILIRSGGERHFMPEISPSTHLDIPGRKKYGLFGERIYSPYFFAANQAEKCIDFTIPEVYAPSPEQLEQANASLLASKVGTEKPQIPAYIPIILIVLLFMQIITWKVLGVF